MERLSNNLHDIVGKVSTQRRQQSEQRQTPGAASQGQRSQVSQSARYPLPEQRANLGQRNPYASQQQQRYNHAISPKKTQNFIRQEESGAQHEGRSYRPSVPMPANNSYAPPSNYQHPQPAMDKIYQQSSISRQYNEGFHPRATSIYRTDDYGHALHADALQQWEDDVDDTDDMEGMREGDWEAMVAPPGSLSYPRAETMAAPRTPLPYQSAETIIRHRRSSYASTLPEVTRIEEVAEEPRNFPRNPRRTRDLRTALTSPSMPPALPPAPRSPLPAPRPQGARPAYQQRDTQPLNPTAAANIGREREQPERVPYHEPQKQLPLVPAIRETTTAPYVPTPAPTNQKGVCPKCRGAGYLRADVPFGHPNFGKPIPCECKEVERKEKRRQQLRDMSNLDAFRDRTFRTFNSRVPGVQEAYDMSYDYAQEPEGWLLLVGPNGCGKTHLAAAIANQCLEDGAVVLFAVVPDLLDHLRAAFAPTSTEIFDQLFSKMREAEVLILDDLGSQQSSPWANEKLFQLLNYRYNMGMPTVITANPRGMQGVDERIRSRLTDVSLVEKVDFDRARDYRPHHPRRD